MEKTMPPNKTVPLAEEVSQERAIEETPANINRGLNGDDAAAPKGEKLGKSTWGGGFAKRNKGKHNGHRHSNG